MPHCLFTSILARQRHTGRQPEWHDFGDAVLFRREHGLAGGGYRRLFSLEPVKLSGTW